MRQFRIEQFNAKFPDEASCVEAVYQSRWPDGFRCPVCGHGAHYLIETRRLPLYECRSCKHQASLTSQTIMHGSNTPLSKWLLAIYLMSSGEADVNAVQLTELLGVTYKTAWRMMNLIRCAVSMRDEDKPLLGTVEAKLEIYMKQFIPAHYNLHKEQAAIVATGKDEEGYPHCKIKLIQRSQARTALTEQEQTLFRARHCSERDGLDLHVNRHYQQFRKLDANEWNRIYANYSERLNEVVTASGDSYLGGMEESLSKYALSRIADNIFRRISMVHRGIGRKYAQGYLDFYQHSPRGLPLLQAVR